MIKLIPLFAFMICILPVNAQITESFSDGDYSNGVVWNGSPSAWQIIASSDVSTGAAGSNTLRLSVSSGGGLKYLSTQVPGSWGAAQTWSCWIGRRGQAATSSNISYVWLYASNADLSSASINGYRIRFGDDATAGDRIILESVVNGIATTILTSSGSTPNGITDFGFLLRVTKNPTAQWSIYTSVLPTASGSGATANTVPDEANTSVLQASGAHNPLMDFANGYVAFAALHTTGTTARAGVEFDQLTVQFASGSPLPVRFSGFTCMETNEGVQLNWINLTEEDIHRYIVERSLNGQQFDKVAETLPVLNNGGPVSYRFTDNHFSSGDIFYRIRAEETTGKNYYTSILRLSKTTKGPGIRIFPNPVQGTEVGVFLSALQKGHYKFSIYDGLGIVRNRFELIHRGGSWSRTIEINDGNRGIYYLKIEGPVHLVKMFVVQ